MEAPNKKGKISERKIVRNTNNRVHNNIVNIKTVQFVIFSDTCIFFLC